ncbi:hypothetical protein BGX38DRAFT_1146752 [Terfezia claveryi]|nr:hypothetical protein BGX38DRAFT_1146752 [Terfezia claveryi]
MRMSQAMISTAECFNNIFPRITYGDYLNEISLPPLIGPDYCVAEHHPDPTHDWLPIPTDCNNGGMNITLSLSVNKFNPLNLPAFNWYDVAEPIIATTNIYNTNPYPVNFDATASPADARLAGDIGVFRLYCHPNWRHIPVAQVNAECNGRRVSRVRIPAGEAIEVRHKLGLMTDELKRLPDGKYHLRVEGYWRAFQQERPAGPPVLEDEAAKAHDVSYCFLSEGVEIDIQRS